jgi:putative serine protease PepD
MHTPKALLTLVVATVLGAGGGAAVVAIAGDRHATSTTIEALHDPAAALAGRSGAGGALSAEQVYAHAKGSVAYVTAQLAQQGQATGSGFVVAKQGLIVTNAHVVEGATTVSVKVGDGATHPASVVGRDESTDLALLRVRDAGGKTFAPLQLADSGRLQVGDAAYAIGNPYGLDRTLTSGVVSALDRRIDAPNGYAIDKVVQTDAPINPGNSGGPLLDDHGRVIGVNSQVLTGGGSSQSGNVGIGFAIPSSTVATIVRALEADGHVAHAYLGVQLTPSESGSGARIAGLAAGGPAERAGVRAGDAIVALDGRAISDAASLSTAVDARQPGDAAKLVVERHGARRTLTVTLGTRPQQPASGQAPQQVPGSGRRIP